MGRRSRSVTSPEFINSDMDNDDSETESTAIEADYSSSSSSARSSPSSAAGTRMMPVPASVSVVPSTPLKTVTTIANNLLAGSSKSHRDKANKQKKDKLEGALIFALIVIYMR